MVALVRSNCFSRSSPQDSIDGATTSTYLALIYAWTGKKDAAISQLEAVAKIPGPLSHGELKLDPAWDPIRNDPGFQRLLAGKEQVGPNS